MIKQKLLHFIPVQSLTRCLPLHLKPCTLEIALTMDWVLCILCYLLCFVWQYQWSLDSGIEVWWHMMTSAEPDFYLSYLPQSWLIIRDDWLIDHLDLSPWASSLSSLTRWLIPDYIYCKAVSWWFGEDVSTEQLLIKITVVLCFYTGVHGQDLILQRLGAGIEDNGQFAYPAGYKSLILYIHEILHPVLQRFLNKILNLL